VTTTLPKGLEEVFSAVTSFYRVSIQVPSGGQLTDEDWEQTKSSISAQIEYLKNRLSKARKGEEAQPWRPA
jgi:hypothetical protein